MALILNCRYQLVIQQSQKTYREMVDAEGWANVDHDGTFIVEDMNKITMKVCYILHSSVKLALNPSWSSRSLL